MSRCHSCRRTWPAALKLCQLFLAAIACSTASYAVPPVADEGPGGHHAKQRQLLEEAPDFIGGIKKEEVLFYSRLWPLDSTIRVAFDGTHPKLYEEIASLANQWVEGTRVKFDFGQEHGFFRWSRSDEVYDFPIRVGFEPGAFYSYIGTECALAKANQPTTMISPLAGDKEAWRASVLHEFGHVLGIPHAFSHPNANVDINKDRFQLLYGSAFESFDGSESWVPLNPAPDSVMNFSFPPEVFWKGKDSPWYRPFIAPRLSGYDRTLVQVMYGYHAARPIGEAVRYATLVVDSNTCIQPEPSASNEPVFELQQGRYWELVDPSLIFKLTVAMNYSCKIVASEDFKHPFNAIRFGPNDHIGTGFLVSDCVVMTCNHVVPDDLVAKKIYVDFEFARSQQTGNTSSADLAKMPIAEVIYTSQNNDFSLLRLQSKAESPGERLKYYRLSESAMSRDDLYVKPLRVIILQYPAGSRLQLALNEQAELVTLENSLIELHYFADTLGGSSGGPVFSRYGRLLGMHQKAGPKDPDLQAGIHGASKYNVGMPIERILNEIQLKCSEAIRRELGLDD